jgi:hypothetical protein
MSCTTHASVPTGSSGTDTRESGAHSPSGARSGSGANLVTVGAGRVVHIRMYVNRQEALEAAGLQESGL